ncbi:hypothetical protein HYR99_41460 [Candidatus Poribacteria bacterium]|nr:hypothetical protein [Candidatus Poribacteria bacterium]
MIFRLPFFQRFIPRSWVSGFLIFWLSGPVVLWLSGFFLLLAVGHANAVPKVTFQFDEWVDFALEKLETDGVTGRIHRHTRPWTRWDVARAVHQAEERVASGHVQPVQIDLELLEKLKREFKEEIDILAGGEAGHRFRVRASPQLRHSPSLPPPPGGGPGWIAPASESAFLYEFGNRLTLYQEFEVENSAEKYPVQGKTASQYLKLWRGDYTGDFKRVYVRFPLIPSSTSPPSPPLEGRGEVGVPLLEVLIGREPLFWGTGFRGAVGISDNSPPFDLILLTGQFGRIKGTAFAAQLDGMWHDQEGPARRYLANRYLSGHRLDGLVSERIEVGLSEIIVYGGDVRGVEWKYLNPILPYYASQFNAGTDDNVMFQLEGAIRPIDGFRLYGEWLIDDFQYVNGNAPNALAWLAGVEWNRALTSRQLMIRAEYARVNRWAYTHRVQENQYLHFGSIIGHRVGIDADTFYLEGGYLINADFRVTLFYEFERQGEAGVEDRYRGEDYKSIPFPSGIVERRDGVGVRLVYEPLRAWQLDVAYQHGLTRNRDHRAGVRQNSDELEFRLRYLFEY